jgi:hypothetical protein
MAGIGTGVIPPRPDRRLTSDAPRLPVRWLPKIGGTVTLTWLEKPASASLTRPSPTRAVVSMAGVEVEIVLREWPMPTVRFRQRGVRTRFVCPKCEASRDALHWLGGEWGCRGRGCFDLSYACRHRQRYCTAIARRARLRRKLIRTPPRSLKARALRKMIAREGRAMIAHMEKVNRDISRRSRRDARHRRANPE